ncbi:glutaredoxin family protein [Cyanobium sp. FGCU-6]|jgi:hypothetical protein|nr:glutaredoxin family protein [Cyanobium sp. FGCU6]
MPHLPSLLLFSRQGCCLCEGLEERLRALPQPPPLRVVDVDLDPALRARYDLSVPVLALEGAEGEGWQELPRVPPRLGGERLADWLVRHGAPAPQAGEGAACGESRHSTGGQPGHSP